MKKLEANKIVKDLNTRQFKAETTQGVRSDDWSIMAFEKGPNELVRYKEIIKFCSDRELGMIILTDAGIPYYFIYRWVDPHNKQSH